MFVFSRSAPRRSPRLLFLGFVVGLLGSSVVACTQQDPALSAATSTDETVESAPGAKPATAVSKQKVAARPTAKTAKNRARPVGDAPPRPDQPGLAQGIRMDINIQDGNERTRATVTSGFGGVGIDVKHGEEPPATNHKQRRAPARTCKKALLANGHAAAHLVHCDDVNDACAVALLNAKHPPSSLVHCEDVDDVSCAVQLLKRGSDPSEIVHCD